MAAIFASVPASSCKKITRSPSGSPGPGTLHRSSALWEKLAARMAMPRSETRIFNIKNPQISQYTFMAGPELSLLPAREDGCQRLRTVGAGIGKFDSGSKNIPAEQLGMWPSETRAVFSAGVNLDYNFYPNLAFRVTPTYLGSTWGGTVQNNLGVNLGARPIASDASSNRRFNTAELLVRRSWREARSCFWIENLGDLVPHSTAFFSRAISTIEAS